MTASLAQKASYLARTLQPWGERIAPIEGPAPARRLGYRDRVTLTARWAEDTGWRFGLMRRDELIAIHDCPVHTARVRSLVHLLARRLPPGRELPLAYLHVCGAQATLIVKARHAPAARLDDVLAGLADMRLEEPRRSRPAAPPPARPSRAPRPDEPPYSLSSPALRAASSIIR